MADLRMRPGFAGRRIFPWLAGASLLLAALAGCSHGRPPADEIRFNISEDPHSLNPILAQSDDERQIAHLMFDLLLDVDARGRLIPALALRVPTQANGDISPDGRRIVYHLRDDVRWQDGQALTASDVVFTWQAITDPASGVQSTRAYDLIDLIYAPDPYTVVIQLRRAWPPAVATFFTYGTAPMPILPQHLFGDGAGLRRSSFSTRPVGSGPYRLVRWERGDRLVFAANDAYYRGKPKTATIVVEEVPDTNSALTMLRSGQLDWSLQSPAQRLAMGAVAHVRTSYAPFSGFGAIAFNCRRPPFDDERMRRAIAMSIDRTRLSRGITGGQYPVSNSDQPPFSWAFDPTARLPDFKPARADRELDELGWRRGADGVRRRDGRPLALIFVTFPESDTAVRTAEYVQQMLRDRGIDIVIKKVSLAQFYLPSSAGGLLLAGRFDLAYMSWRTGVDPDDSDMMTCKGPANYAGYCDARLDRLEGQALSTQDRVARRRVYGAVQHLLAAAVPYDFLYAPRYSFAVGTGVRGFDPTPYSPTWNAFRWHKVR
jgi:peptide/nickel transport system substrate-binding protein